MRNTVIKMRKTVMKEKIYPILQQEGLTNLICFDMCGITYPDPHYSISRPSSHTACIEYIESGTGVVQIGNHQFQPSGGDSYFLHTGMDQRYHADPESPWKKYFVNITGPLVADLIESYHLAGRYHFKNLNLKDDLCAIISLAKKTGKDNSAQMVSVLNRMLFRMHCHCLADDLGASIANRMRDFSNTKTESDFRMEELCDYIGKSESQTIKIFKNAFATTPYRYLLDKKIELAKKLLRNTNLSVKEIAMRLRFADEYYFSNVFKQKCGKSPSAYRKNDKQ